MRAGEASLPCMFSAHAENQGVLASAEGTTSSLAGMRLSLLRYSGRSENCLPEDSSVLTKLNQGIPLDFPFNTSRTMHCASSVLQCRSTAETETQPSAAKNGAEPSEQRADGGRQARQAVAAKISAARALARKLSEEQQAAVTAAKLAAEQAMDEGEIDRCELLPDAYVEV